MNFLKLTTLLAAVFTFSACGVGEADIAVDETGTDTLSDSESALAVSQAKFQTFVGRDGQTYFHLMAGNGQKVLSSEGYASLSGAKNGIASVKTNGVIDSRYLQREAADGASYFVLVAGNGQIIGTSQMYSTASNATRGAALVQNLIQNVVAEEAAQAAPAKFEVFKGLDARYYFHVKAGNGEIVLQSQSYSSKASATNGVSSVQSNGANAARYQVLEAADGRFYFVLKASNGATIGRGEMYASKSNAQRGVDSLVTLLSAPIGR